MHCRIMYLKHCLCRWKL